MEDTFRNNWRAVVLPLLLTAVVVGSALGFAFY
jgi:ABC-type spermidine/putrescine transport system permease subunit II